MIPPHHFNLTSCTRSGSEKKKKGEKEEEEKGKSDYEFSTRAAWLERPIEELTDEFGEEKGKKKKEKGGGEKRRKGGISSASPWGAICRSFVFEPRLVTNTEVWVGGKKEKRGEKKKRGRKGGKEEKEFFPKPHPVVPPTLGDGRAQLGKGGKRGEGLGERLSVPLGGRGFSVRRYGICGPTLEKEKKKKKGEEGGRKKASKQPRSMPS